MACWFSSSHKYSLIVFEWFPTCMCTRRVASPFKTGSRHESHSLFHDIVLVVTLRSNNTDKAQVIWISMGHRQSLLPFFILTLREQLPLDRNTMSEIASIWTRLMVSWINTRRCKHPLPWQCNKKIIVCFNAPFVSKLKDHREVNRKHGYRLCPCMSGCMSKFKRFPLIMYRFSEFHHGAQWYDFFLVSPLQNIIQIGMFQQK